MRPSIHDWLARASASQDPAEQGRCLDAAIDEADGCHDWRAILLAAAELSPPAPERLAELARRTLISAQAEPEIWGFRDVADVRAKILGDRRGAHAALEACEACFVRPRPAPWGGDETIPTCGYEWVLLAKGFVETLDDREGARRCLEAGREQAQAQDNADYLVSIASGFAELIDPETGAALLREAETLATNGSARPWTLANAWRALGDEPSVARVLDSALRAAKNADDALHIALAHVSHERRDSALRALARTRELATSAKDWLAVAELTYDLELGDGPLREALESAEPLAEDPSTRARIATAYHRWLGDDAAAARLGPRGRRPAELRQIIDPLSDWDPSADALFDWLRGQVTDDELREIADADYGMDADKHLLALHEICESGLIPRSLLWGPHEVLALTRWSSGERVNHVERALCSLLLCLAPSGTDDFETNGVILAESCLALGPTARSLGERFFAWFAGTTEVFDDEHVDDVDEHDEINEIDGEINEIDGEINEIDDEINDDDDDDGHGHGDEHEINDDDDDEHDEHDEHDVYRPFALLLLYVLRVSADPDDPKLGRLAERIVDESPGGELARIASSLADSMRAKIWSDLLGSLDPAHPPSGRLTQALGGGATGDDESWSRNVATRRRSRSRE